MEEYLTVTEYDKTNGNGAFQALEAATCKDYRQYYTLKLEQSTYSRKFQAEQIRISMTFKNLKEVDDVESLVLEALEEVLNGVKKTGNPQDRVGVSLNHPAMDKPFYIPFMAQHKLSSEHVYNAIEKLLQSNKNIDLESGFTVEITRIYMPVGCGKRKGQYRVDWSDWQAQHSGHGGCFIRIKNNDDLCCPRAIVVAKAKLDNDPQWEAIRKGEKIRSTLQKRMAKELMKNAGLAEHNGGCGMAELEKLQSVLVPEYQIKVFRKEDYNCLFYEGPPAAKKICLYLYEEHYDVITSVPAFMDTRHYCHECNKTYRHQGDHICNAMCYSCMHRPPCPSDGDPIYCIDCNRFFLSQQCFENHKRTVDVTTTKREHKESSVCTRKKRCRKCGIEYMTRKTHTCGTFYCTVCKKQTERANHRCYMQNFEEKKEPKGYIFFDFETTQDTETVDNGKLKEYRHKINACVVQKVCNQCKDKPLGHCDICGTNQIIFKGLNTQENFCKWLFQKENSGWIAFAHNAKGFDSHFVLEYLERQSVKPTIVCRGLAIILLEVHGIKVIDSLSFLPMPLSSFPKAFNLKELKKGYFPHLFNKEENWNYIGKLPCAEFYDPDRMKSKERKAFLKWHKAHKDDIFNLEKELIDYCESDVNILREGCLKFLDVFKANAGMNPFSSAVTIAQACHQFFRKNYLTEDTIGLIPHGGYRNTDKFSVMAIRWLKWLSHTLDIRIRHALNGGEVRVGPYRVDGMAHNNTVFEFHGCAFHGCPICFKDRNRKLPMVNKTVEEAYQRTIERRRYLQQQGYNVVEMWECDLKQQLNSNEHMRKFFAELPLEGITPIDPRQALTGGRTNAVVLHYKTKENEKIRYVDVCSLYPWVCKYGTFPLGHPEIHTEGFLLISNTSQPYNGLIKCRVLPPRGLLHPVLPYKANNKLCFPLCKRCVEDRNKETCNHSDADRALTGTWVSLELYKAVQLGYIVLDTYKVWHYEKVCDELFKGYIDCFLKLKTQASGWPKWVKTEKDKVKFIKQFEKREGIELEAGEVERNESLRQLAKLMLNSFWGKFAQNDNLSHTDYFVKPAELTKCASNPAHTLKAIKFVSSDMVLATYEQEEDFIKTQPYTNVVVAAFVTAQARLKLYSYIERLQERVLYFDTDSVIYMTRPIDTFELPTGSFLGDLTDELADYGPGAFISEFVSGGPKNYAFEVFCPSTGEVHHVIKIRGFTLNYDTSKQLNFETLKAKVMAYVRDGCQDVTKVAVKKIVRKPNRSIVTQYSMKQYRIVYDKRRVLPDFTTLPYGY